jgi:hypothetical protein
MFSARLSLEVGPPSEPPTLLLLLPAEERGRARPARGGRAAKGGSAQGQVGRGGGCRGVLGGMRRREWGMGDGEAATGQKPLVQKSALVFAPLGAASSQAVFLQWLLLWGRLHDCSSFFYFPSSLRCALGRVDLWTNRGEGGEPKKQKKEESKVGGDICAPLVGFRWGASRWPLVPAHRPTPKPAPHGQRSSLATCQRIGLPGPRCATQR